MRNIDFTIDSRYTPRETKEYAPISKGDLFKKIKKELAKLLNTSINNIHLAGNIKPWYFLLHILSEETTRNINIIMESENINLITLTRLIRRAGMSTVYIPVPKTLDEKSLTAYPANRVYMLITSLIEPNSGRRIKIQNLTKYLNSNNIKLFVDGSFSTGAITVNIERLGIDIYLSEGHYWLEGPRDTGFIYLKEKTVEIPKVNLDGEEVSIVELIGTQEPITKYAYLLAKLQEINRIGISKIEESILTLTGWLSDELIRLGYRILTPRNREDRGGIVSIELRGNTEEIVKILREKHGISVDKIGTLLRICIKKNHDEEDISYLIDALKEMRKQL